MLSLAPRCIAMSSPLTLLVLVSTLILVVDCQSKLCRHPYKQTPNLPNKRNGIIEVTHYSASPEDVVGTVRLNVSKELSSIPRIVDVRIIQGNASLSHVSKLRVTSKEWYLFIGNGTRAYRCDIRCELYPLPVNRIFNFPSNEFAVLASTMNKDTIVLIVKSTFDGKVTNAVFSSVKVSGLYELQSQSAAYKNSNIIPSAITDFDEKFEQFVVFIGEYWTLISSDQLNQLNFLDLYLTNQLRLARTWVGCPVELCFEGDLDAAVNLNGNITVFRGNYSWILNIGKKELGLPQDLTDAQLSYVDAAFSYSNGLNFIVNNRIVVGTINFTETKEPSVTEFPINAAFTKNFSVVLLSKTMYTTYEVIASKLNQTGTGRVDTLWPGLPDDIDAAVELSQDVIIFFKGSYHYDFKANISGPVVPTLTMNTLYKCADSFYANYTSDINIRTFQEFSIYMKKYTTNEQSTSSQPDVLASASSKLIKPVLVSVAVIAVLVLILIGGILVVKRIKQNEEGKEVTSLEFSDSSSGGSGGSIRTVASSVTEDIKDEKGSKRIKTVNNSMKSLSTI